MKRILYMIMYAALLCGTAATLRAQQVNTLYFMDNVPTRQYLNPAFQPLSKVYISLPAIGYTSFGLMNNSLALKDVVQYRDGRTMLFLNPQNADGRDNFLRALRGNTMLRTDLQMNLLGFGFRTGDGYWNFSLQARMDGQVSVPRDLFRLALEGTPELYGNRYDLSPLGADVDAYLEAGLGYSHQINDKWTVGGKVKFLYGIANASTLNNSLELTAGMDQWTLRGSGTLNVSSPLLLSVSEESIGYEMPGSVMDWVRPSGLGAGIDLGVTYKPIEALTLSAAVTDLGFIRWQGNPNNVTYSIDYAFDGFVDESTDLSDESWQEGVMDTLANALTNSMNYELGGTNPFTTSTSPKLNVGAEYGLWDYKLSFGVLSRTMLHKRRLYEEVTLAVTGRPANWFNLGVSYSFLNGNFGSMGIGVGLRSGIINWFVTADYVSLSNARLPLGLEGGLSNLAIPVPYKAKGMNFAVGINFVFGNKQDRDRDGVKDKFDLCPDTPRKVLVDEHGCPLDTDGDGVPDYLDQCPGTPSTAKGMVDSIGCPIDTDGDGVFDYEDQCPDTPEAAYGQVGPDGCPLDTDGDGVPDYLDKCPDTPAAAWGKVDEDGCPLDTDGDGVPDYLDRCADTPREARGQVDEYGCPLDADGDGVPDYLDQCPGTPAEVKGLVDSIGCPLDTDGDGVPDYLDYCPRTPGVPANNGCPEVKQEVRSLFQKALQGIQFETGKSTIKRSSYPILDQIVQVMKDNPEYKLEIQGHTDNTGSKERNLEISELRAAAVKAYLVKHGIDTNRITSAGYGDTRPVADNKTAAGRAKNRRVELTVSFEQVSYETVQPDSTAP